MKPTILILWLLFSRDYADSRGSIAMQEFTSSEACEAALIAAKKIGNIGGICVAK